MKGNFITFEGSEGSGKSTQSELLFRYLKQKGLKVLHIREPGGTKISEKMREVLLDLKNESMSEACETMLYMAARAQLIEEVIKPALSSGKTVICDRFVNSTIAYQGYGLGVDIKAIRELAEFATKGIRPGITIFLDLPVRQGLKHRQGTKDRIEKRNIPYHERVRNGYLKIASQEPGRFKVVKVEKEKENTQASIRKLIDKFLEAR